MLHRIRWIAFDAVGTLIYPDPPVAAAYHRVAVAHGSRLTEEEISRRFSAAFRDSESEASIPAAEWLRRDLLQSSEQHEHERWRRIVAEVIDDVDDPESCFDELYGHFAEPRAWKCFPDTAQVLPALRQRGYRLAVASNFDRRLHAVCDGLPELGPIELRVISAEVGYRKPSRWFYNRLMETAGVAPHEILMVGDDLTNDIEGGRAAGLPVVELSRGNSAAPSAITSLSGMLDLLPL